MSEDPAATSASPAPDPSPSRPVARSTRADADRTRVPPADDAPLARWLDWIDAVHPSEMDLGLGRVSRVAARLGLDRPPMPVVIVGGTNGKGSTVAMLEAIWTAAGYRTGAATSPHVVRFAERVRVGGEEAADADIARALARVERGRHASGGDASVTLTYFEFATLAAMAVFVEAGCDVAIMEVGLGGRLDAVNLWDADVAVLTSIALDHADWLGDDVSVIATEKAAIGRSGRPLVVGEPSPPASLGTYAREQGLVLVDVGGRAPETLPEPSLPGLHQRRNAGCALAVVAALGERLPVDGALAREALRRVAVRGRFEERRVDGVTLVADVAHNPAAAAALADAWRARFGDTRAVAVFAALVDKDVEGIVEALRPIVGHWVCTSIGGARAVPSEALAARVRAVLEGGETTNAGGAADAGSTGSAGSAGSAGSIVNSGNGSQAATPRSVNSEDRVSVRTSVAEALADAVPRAADASCPVLVSGCFGAVTAAHAALGA